MKRPESNFSHRRLRESLKQLPTPDKYWVGFSGGADSTALLQALFESRDDLATPVHALHFHHGLQAGADDWSRHCQAFCRQRAIPCSVETLRVNSSGRASLEEASRNSRYRAVGNILGKNEMYLTAHHAEDQAETLFLNLLRGCGIEGLAGIPAIRNLGRGWVARPLLDIRRGDLELYLESRSIDWLMDPSNQDLSFDRNYLRHELFPQLERRWPGLVARLSRTARNARVSATAMARFIEQQSGDLIQDPLKMPLPGLLQLDTEMQALILRQWLRRHEAPMLPEARLQEFLSQLARCEKESRAEVRWQGWMIKHYRDMLWLHRREQFEACRKTAWKKGMSVDLGRDSGRLCLSGAATSIPARWIVRSRLPGDRIRTAANAPGRKIKQLFQSASIPPWLRAVIPVLEWDGEPVALGDWILDHRLHSWLVENEVELRWRPGDPVLDRLRTDCQP